jgi:hypothetical protein
MTVQFTLPDSAQHGSRVVSQKNIVMDPAGPETKKASSKLQDQISSSRNLCKL